MLIFFVLGEVSYVNYHPINLFDATHQISTAKLSIGRYFAFAKCATFAFWQIVVASSFMDETIVSSPEALLSAVPAVAFASMFRAAFKSLSMTKPHAGHS